MAKGEKKLSAALVEKRKEPGRLGDGGGLWLNIKQSGAKSWILRYTRPQGGVTEMGLGSYPAIGLAAARDIAGEHKTLLARGIDPKAHRDQQAAERTPRTFGELADLYMETMAKKWANRKSRTHCRKALVERCAPIRSTPVCDIGTDDVLKVLLPIWPDVPETAMRTRGRIENVLDFAVVEGDRPDGILNPARWRGHLDQRLIAHRKRIVRHHAAMDYRDIPGFVSDLQKKDDAAARAMEMVVLTAGRSGEILKAMWPEIRMDDALWVIPAERMKARQEHIVPLTPRVIQILKRQARDRRNDFVFPGAVRDKPLSDVTLQRLMGTMEITDATPHGFRSSFRDWVGNETDFAREVAEACLAHAVGSQVERAYRRRRAIEKQRNLLSVWANYCLGSQSNVVLFKAGG